jgi:predicted ArsR family transcriptional regulator
MDVPTQSDDALAQPTRSRLFAVLAELRRPAPTTELAERLGLHPNGVRAHLERLQDAGLVRRERERLSRGRPRDSWAISPDALPGGQSPTGYAELAVWLVRSLADGREGVRKVEATGRRIGRELPAGDSDVTGEQQLHDILTSLGFRPEREPVVGDRLTYRLRNCPYRDAVHERQSVVCALHRGITRGMLDAIDPKTKLVGFEPSDPDTAGCLIEVRGRMAAEAADQEIAQAAGS